MSEPYTESRCTEACWPDETDHGWLCPVHHELTPYPYEYDLEHDPR